MKGSETFGDQGCLLLNIGYKEQETSSNKKLSSDTRLLASVIQNIKFSSRKCSIVVISGKYLDQVDEIIMTIDKNIYWMPSAVFLMAEKPGQDIKFNVST